MPTPLEIHFRMAAALAACVCDNETAAVIDIIGIIFLGIGIAVGSATSVESSVEVDLTI